MLVLLEKATLEELSAAVEYATSLGIADADTIRVILEHRRESPVALFCLDSRPHLKLVHVPPTEHHGLCVAPGAGGARNESRPRAVVLCSTISKPSSCRPSWPSVRRSQPLRPGQRRPPGVPAATRERELIDREQRAAERRIKAARFPVLKTLESFDFDAQPSINETLVRELAGGEYLEARENVLLIGNSGTGKTHLATALGFAACAQGRKVRFCGATALVTQLLEIREERELKRFRTRSTSTT